MRGRDFERSQSIDWLAICSRGNEERKEREETEREKFRRAEEERERGNRDGLIRDERVRLQNNRPLQTNGGEAPAPPHRR